MYRKTLKRFRVVTFAGLALLVFGAILLTAWSTHHSAVQMILSIGMMAVGVLLIAKDWFIRGGRNE
jgi:energy-converting hydrogenase Eha subunit E